MTQPMKRYTLPRVPSEDPVNPVRWSEGKLPPSADLTEALARGREPRKLWPVLHAVEDTTKSNLPQLLPVFGWGLIVAVLLGALAKC